MKSLVCGGMVLAITMAPFAAAAQGTPPGVHPPIVGSPGRTVIARSWGPRFNGRWIAGWRAPGGWSAYQPPVRGYVLPGYWINPAYYIGNPAAYRLPAPAPGCGWSRYYDDAVMTDRYGRVIESIPGFDWEQYHANLADGAPVSKADQARQIDDAAAAAAAVASARAKGEPPAGPPQQGVPRPPQGPVLTYDPRAGAPDNTVTYQGRWTGTWTGHYDGQPTTVYNGAFDGRYDGPPPHWEMRDTAGYWGYYGAPAYGYGWGMPMMATISYQPVPIMTTVVTTEEIIYGAAVSHRRPARRIWKPRPKSRCTC